MLEVKNAMLQCNDTLHCSIAILILQYLNIFTFQQLQLVFILKKEFPCILAATKKHHRSAIPTYLHDT